MELGIKYKPVRPPKTQGNHHHQSGTIMASLLESYNYSGMKSQIKTSSTFMFGQNFQLITSVELFYFW
jgi:hypothetical protein